MDSLKPFNAVAAALALLPACHGVATAQPSGTELTYPEKPIRLVVPFSPGGSGAIISHLVGAKLTDRWGKPVLVDYRGGGSGVIGAQIAAKANPDGYTLLFVTSSTIVLNPLISKVPFDPIKDFAPIIWVSSVPFVLLLHPAIAVRSVKELISHAKSKPRTLNFSSGGNGSIGHLSGELFNVVTGSQLVHVAYKGGGPALVGVIGGEVQVAFENLLPALPFVTSEQLRALAVTTRNRSSSLPELPTMHEAGVNGYDVQQWNGFLAPARTPRNIVLKLNREIGAIINTPEVREPLARQGAEVAGGSPEKLADHMLAESRKWAQVIKDAGLRFD